MRGVSVPNTKVASPSTWRLELDEKGFIRTGQRNGPADSPFHTSPPGIFAMGEVRSNSVKRVASVVGEGSVVIQAVCRHLAGLRGSLMKESNDDALVQASRSGARCAAANP